MWDDKKRLGKREGQVRIATFLPRRGRIFRPTGQKLFVSVIDASLAPLTLQIGTYYCCCVDVVLDMGQMRLEEKRKKA